MKSLTTTCLIAGGGPAGMMAGLLLARAGVDVIVLEKHEDFLRDFRGDTVHPSTMQVLHELGLLEDFLKRPHQEITTVEGEIGNTPIKIGDLTHLPTAAKFIALMPQWEFLNFLSEKAKAYPNFHLMMRCEARFLVVEGERVCGLRVDTPEGMVEIKADLVIGADGRHLQLRATSGLTVKKLGVPIDVLWLRIAHHDGDAKSVFGRITNGAIFVMLYCGDYWQCALVIRKDGLEAIKAEGIDAFRARVAALAHRARADEIASWDDVKLLTVAVDRLERWWRPGLLFIGDAAHAMSPIGGVGINLAIQDAVAASNILAKPLLKRALKPSHLVAVQKRRRFPTWITQAMQVAVQNTIMRDVLGARASSGCRSR
ncbi:MAG TPA: FAD-dependent oxidoreductase [Rhizomicrobium sp.]|jgi:2-polyprenyl-6-methoxyphenol hydroxylase-like FAD-dependent oxidoreductase|nr:FAD-dependent oxidoreductase [Rhizomicrobium sp.]